MTTEEYIEGLLNRIKESFSEAQYESIEKAYEFAATWHKDIRRRSGDAYIVHPCAVAEILLNLGMDAQSLQAAFLHDVIEDTEAPVDEMFALFGSEVMALVDGLTKLSRVDFPSKDIAQAENLRKLMLAMCNDIRVVIIKLADRLHNMRTLGSMPVENQKRTSKETLDIFAPLSARLGIMQIKGELEDLSFYYLYPEEYKKIDDRIKSMTNLESFIDNIKKQLTEALEPLNIKYELSGRRKHYYSIYRKMTRNACSFDEVYDLVAVRVIIDGPKELCYEVLGTVHSVWNPLLGRIKDYISVPKANNYSSLHTTVLADNGTPFEIQIRTTEMHRVAEYGIAAHWKYKDGKTDKGLDEKIQWLRQVIEAERDDYDSQEFINALKTNLFSGDVFVYTPDGKVMHLPVGSTVVDFAYAVHSEVGNRCSGAIVNSRFVPITTVLQNGDIVKVQTNGKRPSLDWLNFVKSSGAKNKIRAYFKRVNKEENIKTGREMLEYECKRRHYKAKDLFTPKRMQEALVKYSALTEDDLYAQIGSGVIKAENVFTFFINRLNEDLKSKTELPEYVPHTSSDSGVLINGEGDMLVRLSKCCNPVPGDSIVGYISRGRGISVHRLDCPNVRGIEDERLISAEWASVSSGSSFSVALTITAYDRKGLVADICSLVADLSKVTLTSIAARVDRKSGRAKVFVNVELDSIETLAKVKRSIGGIKGVVSVDRS